ncbi:MAG: PAS domain-containing protein [Lentisphaerae bacterium]|nr:PAS domain-containing protein [Lentisphaerota bacterium]
MHSSITEAHERAILQWTPNGVLLVDRDGSIRFANPSFRRMFRCDSVELLGQPVSRFLESDCFVRAMESSVPLTVNEGAFDREVCYRASIFPIEGEDLFCGIFTDISEEELAKKHYRELRAQTLQRAQEVITRQMKTAQEIARLLGETTAETKVLLVKLMSLFEAEKSE